MWGLYVVMFLEILRTLVRAIIVFSILIVAFGMAFYILLATEVGTPNSSSYKGGHSRFYWPLSQEFSITLVGHNL